MKIKMIAVDMDGTFLNDQKTYNVKRFYNLFSKLQEKEIRFVVASGNQYFQLRSFFPDIYQYITFVSEKGANIVMGDESFYHAKIESETILATLILLESLDPVNLVLCGQNSAYVSKNMPAENFKKVSFYYPQIKKIDNLFEIQQENDDIFKFALTFEAHEAKQHLETLKHALGNTLVPVSSGHGDIDLIIPGVHKHRGLTLVGKEWGIQDSEIATFGDSGNDLEMIKNTAYSFAMENAQEQVKQAAKMVIGSNNTEAILDEIERILKEA